MNLQRFKTAFTPTSENSVECNRGEDFGVEGLGVVLEELGGKTFNHGLYRVYRGSQVPEATKAMEMVFPEYRGRIVPFGFDWLGRHFAVDRKRIENGQPQTLMLEIGVGEAIEIPASVADFHTVELVEYADDVVAVPFYKQWRSQNTEDLAFSDCVGYKVPLFLGGRDVLANLEVIDLSVYAEICGQLRNKLRTLPAGQSIRDIVFEDMP